MKHPIPLSALDDRLFFGGTAGSGKTYNAIGGIERGLAKGHRFLLIDPLGVAFGLRLMADGLTPSRFNVVIFGGRHSDLPLTEYSGALIGETVAGMKESCILDLSELGTKASERRFMLAFLTALYRKKASDDLLTVVFDEADMWAPQQILDKEGDAAKLLGMMETLVRRGRVKGFVPWLISQRPAVVSKNVLSQADGMVIFKLTSSQDRDAIGDWVKGQADVKVWRELHASLPTLERGQGIVWLPTRGILETVKFPAKETFDSSRTPKRGEKKQEAQLQPLDLKSLRERLSKVDAEVKANDPAALRKENADLKREKADLERKLAVKPVRVTPVTVQAGPTKEEIDALLSQADAAAKELGRHEGRIEYAKELLVKIKELEALGIKDLAKAIDRLAASIEATATGKPPKVRTVAYTPAARPAAASRTLAAEGSRAPPQGAGPSGDSKPRMDGAAAGSHLPATLQRVVNAIGWWRKIGQDPVERARACVVAGYSPNASTFGVYIGKLVEQGLVAVSPGKVGLTDAGIELAVVPAAGTRDELCASARGLLKPQEKRVFDVIYGAYPDEISRDQVADAVGLSRTASTVGVYIGGVAAYGIVEKASAGHVKAAAWLFP